jgi:hypothetical protein
VNGAKEFIDYFLIAGRGFQLHQLVAGTFQKVAGFGEELFQ